MPMIPGKVCNIFQKQKPPHLRLKQVFEPVLPTTAKLQILATSTDYTDHFPEQPKRQAEQRALQPLEGGSPTGNSEAQDWTRTMEHPVLHLALQGCGFPVHRVSVACAGITRSRPQGPLNRPLSCFVCGKCTQHL